MKKNGSTNVILKTLSDGRIHRRKFITLAIMRKNGALERGVSTTAYANRTFQFLLDVKMIKTVGWGQYQITAKGLKKMNQMNATPNKTHNTPKKENLTLTLTFHDKTIMNNFISVVKKHKFCTIT